MSWDRYLANVVTLDYDEDKCVGCEMCVQVCAREVFEMVDKKARVVRRDNCIECGACAKNCLGDAIRVRAGVGCAAGIIKDALGIQDDCCCVLNKEDAESRLPAGTSCAFSNTPEETSSKNCPCPTKHQPNN